MEIMREGHQDENTDDDEGIKISKNEKTTNSEMKKQKNERERSRGRPTVNGLFQNFSPVISFRLFGLPEHKNSNQEKKKVESLLTGKQLGGH